jgi:chromosome segregation ATPase
MNLDNEIGRLEGLTDKVAAATEEAALTIKTLVNERDELQHDLNNALQVIEILQGQVKALTAQRDDLAKCLMETTDMLASGRYRT